MLPAFRNQLRHMHIPHRDATVKAVHGGTVTTVKTCRVQESQGWCSLHGPAVTCRRCHPEGDRVSGIARIKEAAQWTEGTTIQADWDAPPGMKDAEKLGADALPAEGLEPQTPSGSEAQRPQGTQDAPDESSSLSLSV